MSFDMDEFKNACRVYADTSLNLSRAIMNRFGVQVVCAPYLEAVVVQEADRLTVFFYLLDGSFGEMNTILDEEFVEELLDE